VGRFGGFPTVAAAELVAGVIREVLRRTGIAPAEVDVFESIEA
jgi:hypothetical protein